MIDLNVRISLALDANNGAYAVLLGSGVSAAAGIPTGWQIVSGLVTKVARLTSPVIPSTGTNSVTEWSLITPGY